METRLIDANALLKKAYEMCTACENSSMIPHCTKCDFPVLYDLVKSAPTVDAVPVKRGNWDREDGEYGGYVLCSECGLNLDVSDYEKQEWREILRFCPSCGADMREVTDADS